MEHVTYMTSLVEQLRKMKDDISLGDVPSGRVLIFQILVLGAVSIFIILV